MNLHFKHFYFRWTKNLFVLFVISAFLLTLARLGFTLVFGEHKVLMDNLPSVRSAFFLGFRYDLMPLAYINAIPFLLLNICYLIPKLGYQWIRKFIIAFLTIFYFILAWLYVCDYGFYSFFQDHINILFFGLFEDDTIALMITIWKNYNVIAWGIFLFIVHYTTYRLIKLMFSPYEFDLKIKTFDWKMPVIFVVGVVSLAFAARGNFTRLPLSIEDAHISKVDFINKISINGPLSLNRAYKIRKTFGRGNFDYLKRLGFSSWQEAYEKAFNKKPGPNLVHSLIHTTAYNPKLEEVKPHVILLVMESFGSYWNDQNSETFNLLGDLKPHLDQDILFKNFLPAENGTIGSIVSIATSQVIRPGARFLSESEFMKTHLRSSGNLPYKEQGYETHFVYGGKLGWRDLGKYLTVQNYDHLWGADEIKEAIPELNNLLGENLGNEWGIFDEYLYTFIEEKLKTAEQPQLFVVLTTSNHPPFEVPKTYQALPLEFTDEMLSKFTVSKEMAYLRFRGLQYSNHKAGEFISRIKKSALGNKTVVALTGDHSYWIAKGVGSDEEFKRYAVPFYIYAPEGIRPNHYDKNNFGSHEDIFPTLYHVSLSNQKYVKLGENLFTEQGMAVNSSGLVANKKGAYHHKKYWKWKDLKNQVLEESEEEIPGLLSHQSGIISITDLYLKAEKESKQTDEGNDLLK